MSIALVAWIAGCSNAEDRHQRSSLVRVSSSAGIATLTPGAGQAGDTAAALDLVFEFTKDYATAQRVDDLSVVFVPNSSDVMSADALASVFVCAGAEDRRVTESRFFVRFSNARQAEFALSGYCGLDTGPFFVQDESADGVTLRRRSGTGVERIEIVRTTRSEEWRRLMARQIEVVPRLDSGERDQLSQLGSIRMVDITGINGFGLFFQTTNSPWTDVVARRALASAIDTRALGRMVCGAHECGLPTPSWGGQPMGVLPDEAVLLLLEGESTHETVGRVLRHQLRRVGLNLRIEELPLNEYIPRIMSGQFELTIVPLASNRRRRARLHLSSTHRESTNLTGYSNQEYDAAFDRDDNAAMAEILARDVPLVPLYEPRDFAAIDGTLCGDVQPSSTSWRWIADLHPCEP